MQASRDDFLIAIRSAFLKKENKQKFSLLALIFLTFIIILSDVQFEANDYLKISLREVAYRSSFIVSALKISLRGLMLQLKIILCL